VREHVEEVHVKGGREGGRGREGEGGWAWYERREGLREGGREGGRRRT